MCDEQTERDNQALLSRRALGAGVAASALLAGTAWATEAKLVESKVTITTPDGQADGLFVHPEQGKHPGVLMWPDIAGLRPAYETMARRLAAEGFAVLVVNPYYRSAKGHVLGHFDAWRTDEGKAKVMPMVEQLTAEAVTRDGKAHVAWLDQQAAVDTSKKIGTQGYCMSGSFTFRTAAAAPERVGAFASFHGGGLVTDAADSPHRVMEKAKARALVCIAANDHERDPSAKGKLEAAAEAAPGVSAEIEVYPANHGWCALDSPVYDETQANKAWERLLATYRFAL
jgi:carboxymethylenebutenolidase